MRLLLLLLIISTTPLQAQIAGVVRDSATGLPISGATVLLLGTPMGARTAHDGSYHIAGLAPGAHIVRARALGYRPSETPFVSEGTPAQLDFTLPALAVTLAEVVVTPGRFTLMEGTLGQASTLSRADIQTMPQIGEDIYRTVNRLPGMTSSEMSAKFWVRGGSNEELLVRLDGLELYEPFHLKDFDGSLSIIDVQSVNGVELLTGGFAADYGNRLTGVFNLETSHDSIQGVHGSAGITLGNARLAARGGFARAKGQWMLAARRGYVDVILKLFNLLNPGEEVIPRYYDGLGTLHYRFNDHHVASVSLLTADDRTTYHNSDSPVLKSGYVSSYLWGTWRASFTPRASAQTILSTGRLSWRRNGAGMMDLDSINIADRRRFNFAGVKQDWSVTLCSRQMIRFGGEAKLMETEYQYLKWRQGRRLVGGAIVLVTDSAPAALQPDGSTLGGFLAYRVQPLNRVTLELGGRVDHQSYTSETTTSPRASIAWSPLRSTTLRAAWGRYFQPQQLFQLGVQDNDTRFYRAELAEHRVVGLEQAFANGVSVTLEAYERRISRSRPQALNLENDIDAFPEVLGDRTLVTPTSGRARGVEAFVRRRGGTHWDWSLSYALAEVWDLIGTREVARKLDQRHTLYSELGFRPNAAWSMSWAWQYHTGWPYTPSNYFFVPLVGGGQAAVRQFGPINSVRLPSYHRMDVRVSRRFRVGRGELLAFLDVFNVYNRANPRGLFYNVDIVNGSLVSRPMVDALLPILPTFGVSWEF